MDISFKIIVDNSVYVPKIKAEHGLSLLVEYDDERILFDTGQSSLLLENCLKMGIDLKGITKIVLSHSHYDHTGGLLCLLEYLQKEIEIYIHPSLFEKRYIQSPVKDSSHKSDKRYIGIQEKRDIYESLGAKFIHVEKPQEIGKDIIVTGEIPRLHGSMAGKDVFLKETGSTFSIDYIKDDMALLINKKEGTALFCGCCHSGIINTIEYAKTLTEIKNFLIIAGGFHLSGSSESHISEITNYLLEQDIAMLIPSHCTGIEAICFFKNFFKQKVKLSGAGVEFRF